MKLPMLDPEHPVFPSPTTAMKDPDGLVAGGGNLEVETLLSAYQQGIFPWYETGQPILWWSPDPRAVLNPQHIHISRTMRKLLRRGNYEIRVDSAFEQVIRACAVPRNKPGMNNETWIIPEMITAYCRLFEAGYSHSVECWIDEQLVGGLYGLIVGDVFCGESMFSDKPNASKLAFIHLANGLEQAGFALIDCQIGNAHMASMGTIDIPRDKFLDALNRKQNRPLGWPASQICGRVG